MKNKYTLHFHPLARFPLSLTCKVSSVNNNRKNPDSPKNNYKSSSSSSSSKGKFKNYQDREVSIETNQILSSKNGRSTTSNTPTTTTTKPVNKDEILELFRKHLPHLRDAAKHQPANNYRPYGAQLMQEKRDKEERKAFESLLKLLKEHGANRRRTFNGDGNNKSTVKSLEYEEAGDAEESDSEVVIEGESDFDEDVSEELDSEPVHETNHRPTSKFSRQSPVPMVDYEPIKPSSIQGEEEAGISMQEEKPNTGTLFYDSESELVVEQKQSEGLVSEEEQNLNLDSMKLSELREIAKSRGLKGYSKLKKAELIEQLSIRS